jgi:hypothetical protein
MDFTARNTKNYKTMGEYNKRLGIFKKNYKKILEHNSKKASEDGFTKEINKFSDLTEDEFQSMLGYIPLDQKSQQDEYDR